MLQIYFAFINVEIIHGFTSTFVALCSDTSYPFVFPSEDLVTTLRNQDNKVAFIRVNEDGALARPSEFMKTCHNMNIIVQTTGGDAS